MKLIVGVYLNFFADAAEHQEGNLVFFDNSKLNLYRVNNRKT
jgi:hypothetical protein